MFLSVDCYAEIKTFQMYASYAGVLHLGYVDGMYIKYGGKLLETIDVKDLRLDLRTHASFQFILFIIFLSIAFFVKDFTLVAFALVLLPLNISTYCQFLFQATGEFQNYARVTNFTTILTFVANIILLLLRYVTEYRIFLISYVFVDFLLMFLSLTMLQRKKSVCFPFGGKLFSSDCLIANVSSGVFLMLGNFASIILTGMDRLFIKILMDNTAFAMYSFAVAMENMMNVAVTPVSTTLYNYFCCHKEDSELRNIKDKIILFASAIVACAFPAKFILETFITKYLDSTSVIFYLFGAQMFYIIVKCFYVNLYKAQKRQEEYFAKLIAVIVIGFIFNAGFYTILHTKEAFAIGPMLCGVTWYILSELDFKTLRSKWKENLFLLLAVLSYLFLGTVSEALIGLILYAVLLMLLSLLLMRKDVMDCWKIAKGFLER